MKKLFLTTASILVLAVGSASAQSADNETRTVIGGTAGAGVGAVAGAAIGGPIGAVIGGFAGAVIGADAAVPEPAVQYVVANPIEPVAIEGQVTAGAVIPEPVVIQPIPDYPDYGYVYVDGRPVIVQAQSREVVYSPGYVVPDGTVAYIEQNPVAPVVLDAPIQVGTPLPPQVEIVPVPSAPSYGYVYTETGPVLVQANTRTVVWVKG